MITTSKNLFEATNEFVFEIMTKGSTIDDTTGDGKSYILDVTVIRLNHIALNEWIMCHTSNSRDCYEDGITGDIEWNNCIREHEKRLYDLEMEIKQDLGIDEEKGVTITQNVSEIFTVVNIYEKID